MTDTNENYMILRNELKKYYDQIYAFIKLEFMEINRSDLLNIDFTKDFVISDIAQNSFIVYDKKSQKFKLSIIKGIEKFNTIKNNSINTNIDIQNKYEKEFYNYFKEEEQSLILRKYNISFIDFIKSEFLFEFLKKIMNITSIKDMIYEDEYGNYSEKMGFILKDIIVEIITRKFSLKYNLFYLPKNIGNNEILKKVRQIILKEEYFLIILNDTLDTLFEKLPTYQKRYLIKYEEQEFEKKYTLKENTFENERFTKILYQTIQQRKQEISNTLKSVKDELQKKKNLVSGSYGFVNIIYIGIGLILVFITIFMIFYITFRR